MILKNRNKGQKGIALIIVLWVTTAMALLVTSLNSVVRTSIVITGSEALLIKHQNSVESGLEIAAAKLIEEEATRKWLPQSKIIRLQLDGRPIRIKIGDPNGLVDLNKSGEGLLVNLFRQFVDLQKAEKLKDVIISLRPQKSQNRLSGTSSSIDPKNGKRKAGGFSLPFMDLTQFRRLPGVDNKFYNDVLPYLTVHSRDGKINPMTAPVEVLSSIPGMSRLQAEDIVRVRSQPGFNPQYFSNLRSRFGRLINQKEGTVFIVTVTSAWQNTGKYVGKRYVIATKLHEGRPFHLLASRDVR